MEYPTIPTCQNVTHDFGKETNEKLIALKWKPEQYDAFFDYLYLSMSVNDMVELILEFAPVDWIQSEADAIGVFDGDDNDRP